MNILVCAKQVPNTGNITINPVTNTLERKGMLSIQNPSDTYALKLALEMKQKYGSTITMLTMGPKQAEKILNEGLMLGVDFCYLLSDPAFAGSDTYATASILAAAIEHISKERTFDLILCGKKSIDGETGQVGPELAQLLNLGQITNVGELSLENGQILAKQFIENGCRWLSSKFPVLLTVNDISGRPIFYPQGVHDGAKEKKAVHLSAADLLEINPNCCMGLKGSLTKVVRTFMPSSVRKNIIIQGDTPESSVKKLVEQLKAGGII